jgi:hypothetical protein
MSLDPVLITLEDVKAGRSSRSILVDLSHNKNHGQKRYLVKRIFQRIFLG